MSVDKLVDSTQLDSDLTSVANAIRTKGGTSASLDFPADFVTAIVAIPSGAGGLNYKTGSFTMESNKTSQTTVSIPHSLGEVPRIVFVWTEDFDSTHPNSTANTWGGFMLCTYLFNDLSQRLSSTQAGSGNVYQPYILTDANTVNGASTTSASYFPYPDRLPTSTYFCLPFIGTSTYWRTGITYKYIVIGDWT